MLTVFGIPIYRRAQLLFNRNNSLTEMLVIQHRSPHSSVSFTLCEICEKVTRLQHLVEFWKIKNIVIANQFGPHERQVLPITITYSFLIYSFLYHERLVSRRIGINGKRGGLKSQNTYLKNS